MDCGIFGIWEYPQAANLAYLGLYAMQHRGQRTAGIVSSSPETFYAGHRFGRVAEAFSEEALESLLGNRAIAHNSNAPASGTDDIQPLAFPHAEPPFAIAVSGNLLNAAELQKRLTAAGAALRTGSDTELIAAIACGQRADLPFRARLSGALAVVEGAYSLVALTRDELIAARDHRGFRPLVLGELGDAAVIASETCAFDLVQASFMREIEPGEVLSISRAGRDSLHPFMAAETVPCAFEQVYRSRPDSFVFGGNAYKVRKALGRALAQEYPVLADVVVPVPDSGVPAALGFAEASGICYDLGLIRNHYVGRLNVDPMPPEDATSFRVRVKFNAQPAVLAGRRVVVVDDSILGGTTITQIIRMIRGAGARSVHVRVSSPPVISRCHYGGIDPSRQSRLIAATHTVEKIRGEIGADSLGYLSVERLRAVVAAATGRSTWCDACFSGEYPTEIPEGE